MKRALLNRAALLAAFGILGSASFASAAVSLKITEVMSSGSTADWFELTNFGDETATITGYKMDDSSFSGGAGAAVALNGVTTIAAGESVIFMETSNAADATAFKTFWGGISSVQVGIYSGSGVGLSSGASGDGVGVFDASNVLLDSVTFGAATAGVSFGYNPSTSTFGALSAVGVNGAFQSANVANNVGSPGVVPEPATLGLLGCAGSLLLARRRRV